MEDDAHTNALINETSPYLLQHAHNPVDWHAWSDTLGKTAREENKLMIVSIGYSSCHWCHVMEHESFEDSTVAAIMNENYLSVKVDREERPDVDAVYMSAVQLMTGQGGWPLNVITLPDGRPVWGGTYFPKENWKDALSQIAAIYKENPEKLEEYAAKLADGMAGINVIEPVDGPTDFHKDSVARVVETWSRSFDTVEGGMRRAPKFMMPNNYAFLLRYAQQERDMELASFVHKTLRQMAFGGIYDQIGGGFSRYSTDKKWHIPHFEKMLYDNAQLLSLYSKAFLKRPDALYRETVYSTIEFLERDMLDKSGGFYAALDADSTNEDGKLEEGAYYVWTQDELKELLGSEYDLFAAYYNVNDYGFWEDNNYVLIRQDEDAAFIREHELDPKSFIETKEKWHKKLLSHREKRDAPRLDDKILTGWNGLTISGLADAYRTFSEKRFLDMALKTADFIITNQLKPDGSLYRNYKEGNSTINAYLEDYAAVIEAFINLYEVTTDRQWLDHAQQLTRYVTDHFSSKENSMFYFSSDLDEALVTKNIEYQDNVIPASNSIMAKNLFKLGHLDYNTSYTERAGKMLLAVDKQIEKYPGGYSNWLDLKLNYTHAFYEIVVTGKKARQKLHNLQHYFIPNAIFAGTEKDEAYINLLEDRWDDDETWIYVCSNRSCKLPVKLAGDVLALVED